MDFRSKFQPQSAVEEAQLSLFKTWAQPSAKSITKFGDQWKIKYIIDLYSSWQTSRTYWIEFWSRTWQSATSRIVQFLCHWADSTNTSPLKKSQLLEAEPHSGAGMQRETMREGMLDKSKEDSSIEPGETSLHETFLFYRWWKHGSKKGGNLSMLMQLTMDRTWFQMSVCLTTKSIPKTSTLDYLPNITPQKSAECCSSLKPSPLTYACPYSIKWPGHRWPRAFVFGELLNL